MTIRALTQRKLFTMPLAQRAHERSSESFK
jgi:hypothetical protein